MQRRIPSPLIRLALVLGSLTIASSQNASAAPEDHPASRLARLQGRDPRPEQRERGPQRLTKEQLEENVRRFVPREGDAEGALLDAQGIGPGNLAWNFFGPRNLIGEFWSGGAPTSGRVSCIAPDPLNPSTAYAAAAQGGVWKTTDSGGTWTPLTDHLVSLASGWISIDPTNSANVWYATGEQHYSGDSFYGAGVVRSTNGGVTWTGRGTALQTGSYIARIRHQVGSSSTLFVASDLGFVRTTNSGTTWAVTLATGWCNDIALDPFDPLTVYCSVDGGGVYKSTDEGASWSLLAGGLPVAGFQRINLAIAPSSPNILFASFVDPAGQLLGMYKTIDNGATWFLVPAPNYVGSQGWYDNVVAVHPNNPNTVFAGGVYPYAAGFYGVIRSTDGGFTWTDVTVGLNGAIVHPDQHCIAFGSDGTLWLGNDGGVWTSPDDGSNWYNKNDGLSITQFYTVTPNPVVALDALGGTQDNGTARNTGLPEWSVVISGDGGPSLFPEQFKYYTTYTFLSQFYEWNFGAFTADRSGPWVGVDPADWANGALAQDGGTGILVGTNRVWRSTNGGVSWSIISGNLTNGGVLRCIAHAGTTTPGFPSDTLYASSSDGALSYTTNGGLVWVRRDPPTGAVPLADVVVNPNNAADIYVCADQTSSTRVCHSTDAGLTWTALGTTSPGNRRVLCMDVDFSYSPAHLFIGTDIGVWVHRGVNWVFAALNFPRAAVYDLVLQSLPDRVIAATHGRGMWTAEMDHAAPVASLLSPLGPQTLLIGQVVPITWNVTDASPPIAIELRLTRNGFGSTELIANVPNTGSYNWTVTGPPTTNAYVGFIARDPIGNTTSIVTAGSAFTIQDPATSAPVLSPREFSLAQPRPNPGSGPIEVAFVVPRSAPVDVSVYDVDGRRVATLADRAFGPGSHRVSWDGRDGAGKPVVSGVYFVRMNAAGFSDSKSVTLIR